MPLDMLKKMLGIKTDKDITVTDRAAANKKLKGREANSGNITQREMLKKELGMNKKKK